MTPQDLSPETLAERCEAAATWDGDMHESVAQLLNQAASTIMGLVKEIEQLRGSVARSQAEGVEP